MLTEHNVWYALSLESRRFSGGEGRNRTNPGPRNGPTTVLKTAVATRHTSLSLGWAILWLPEGKGSRFRC
jgi:hypothetical protein